MSEIKASLSRMAERLPFLGASVLVSLESFWILISRVFCFCFFFLTLFPSHIDEDAVFCGVTPSSPG